MIRSTVFLLALVTLVFSCKPEDVTQPFIQTEEAYKLVPEGNEKYTYNCYSPFVLPPGVVKICNASYGPHAREKYDLFFMPNKAQKTPLVIFIHGGGFVGGDKEHYYNTQESLNQLSKLVNNGYAVALINYPYLDAEDPDGVLTSLRSGKKFVDLVHRQAHTANIDANRIGLTGGSAGGGIAMWVGFSEEPVPLNKSDQPKENPVKAIYVSTTQASYNFMRWNVDVFKGCNGEQDFLAYVQNPNSSLYGEFTQDHFSKFLGQGRNFNTMLRGENKDFLELIDNLAFMDKDDPVLYVQNLTHSDNDVNFDLTHHPCHSRALYNKALTLGICGGYQLKDGEELNPQSIFQFFKNNL